MYVWYATQRDVDVLRDLFNTTEDDEKYNLWLAWYYKMDDDIWFWSPMIIAKEWDTPIWFAMLDYNTQVLSCSIDKLYVFPPWRKQWIMKLLLDFSEKDAKIKHFNYVRASVFEYNKNMQRCLEKYWYEKIGDRKYAVKKEWEYYWMVYFAKFVNYSPKLSKEWEESLIESFNRFRRENK